MTASTLVMSLLSALHMHEPTGSTRHDICRVGYIAFVVAAGAGHAYETARGRKL